MTIDKRYIDLIAHNKVFLKVPRWFTGMAPVYMMFSGMVAIVGFYQGAIPLFIAGLVILVGVVTTVVVVNRKNRKWQKRFLEKCSRSGRLPDWDWPQGQTKTGYRVSKHQNKHLNEGNLAIKRLIDNGKR